MNTPDDARTPLALAALLREMDTRGNRFVVAGNDLTYTGPDLSTWHEDTIGHWVAIIALAHRGTRTGHHPYACDQCGEVMMLATRKAGRACVMPRCSGKLDDRLEIRFHD